MVYNSSWLTPEEIKDRIDEIRGLTSDKNRVELISAVLVDCASCLYDNIKQESVNPTCLTCGGKGKTSIEISINILAKVRWIDRTDEELKKTGYLPRGGVTFIISNDFEDTVNNTEKIKIDNILVKIVAKQPRGGKEVNRIIYYCETI